uniref:NTF2 domain-containing protein n=1 Tax=Parastrongyloides trichosuri TaxID=131310 RepID=A0A0N4ZMF8_PARTI
MFQLRRKRKAADEQRILRSTGDHYNINFMDNELIGKKAYLEKNYMYRGFLRKKSCNYIKIENVTDHEILNILRDEIEFIPLSIEILGDDTITFIVSSDKEACELGGLSGRIKFKGQCVKITTRPVNYRIWGNLTDKDIEDINEVCCKRYIPEKNALDLTGLLYESVFNKDDSTGATLEKIDVVLIIAEFIKRECPNVEKVSFSSNNLHSLELLQPLLHVGKDINTIDISFNFITNINSFGVLKRFKLETIYLKEFQSDKFFYLDRETAYDQIVQLLTTTKFDHNDTFKEVQYVPKLNYVDYADFSLNFQYKEHFIHADPVYKSFFNGDKRMENIIKKFFERYVSIFDSSNSEGRRNLKKYYHKNGKFSLTASAISDGRSFQNHYGKDQLMKSDNIGFLLMTHNMRKSHYYKNKLRDVLFVGDEKAVNGLLNLPPSKHDTSTFVYDITYVDVNIIIFSVRGLVNFGESRSMDPEMWLSDDVKIFSRSFVVSMEKSCLKKIISDLMTVYPSSEPALKWYRTSLEYLKPLEKENNKIYGKIQFQKKQTKLCADKFIKMTISGEDDKKYRDFLIERLSYETSMIPEYSLRCLEDNDFNYDTALYAFSRNKDFLPSEAFSINFKVPEI